MRTTNLLNAALLAMVLLTASCSRESGPTQAAPAAAPVPGEAAAEAAGAPGPEGAVTELAAKAETPAPEQIPAPAKTAPVPSPPPVQPAASVAKTPAAVAPSPPAAAATTAPVAKPAVAAEPAPAPAATADIVDRGGVVEVVATKPGLTRVGSDECGNCHDVQFTSWSEGPHAARKPPLDCESCHGAGSEYQKKAIMKDPDKARAAGLVMPDQAFCGNCHKKGLNDQLMKQVHAHD